MKIKVSGEGIYNGDIGYIYHIDKENKIYVLFDQVKMYPMDMMN